MKCHGLLFLLAWMLTAGATSAQQVEEITVGKDRGLAGLWRIQVPDRIDVGIFRSAKFGPMRNIFCRIGEKGGIDCLNGGFSRHGNVDVNGDAIHIAWGTAMARFVIDGQRAADTLSGTFSIKVSGIAHDAPVQSRSVRFARPPAAGDDGAAALMEQLRGGPPPNLAGLGPVEQVIYLGPSPNLNGTGGDDYFQVYALEFTGAERICGLKRGETEIAALQCV
jgi:hypothetical protein